MNGRNENLKEYEKRGTINTLRSEFILTQPQPAATRHRGAMLRKETCGIQEGGNTSVLEAVFGLGAKKIRETFRSFDH